MTGKRTAPALWRIRIIVDNLPPPWTQDPGVIEPQIPAAGALLARALHDGSANDVFDPPRVCRLATCRRSSDKREPLARPVELGFMEYEL